jgi:hypothetical protein
MAEQEELKLTVSVDDQASAKHHSAGRTVDQWRRSPAAPGTPLWPRRGNLTASRLMGIMAARSVD